MLYKGKCDKFTKFIFKIDENIYGVLICSLSISIKWVILKNLIAIYYQYNKTSRSNNSYFFKT
jgi:hypothetical protein